MGSMPTMTSRLRALLRVRYRESGLVLLVVSLLFVTNAGGAIGSPGIEALFYSRFGVQFLPVMYIILGLVSPLTSFFMTGVLAKVPGVKLYVALPLVVSFLLAGSGLILQQGYPWFYAVLWLVMNIFWLLQSLFTWGLASLACNTRQAKRLFPLFGVGGIVGLMTGSLLTPLMVNLIGSEYLIFIWAAALLIAFFIAQRLAATRIQPAEIRAAGRQQAGLAEELKQGFDYVRNSPLLRWMSLAAVLFAVLYYALVFPYAGAVVAEFPDENAVASFLGIFQGVATGLAVVASLFFANRLYARFGFMTTILVYPIIYLLGFSVAAVSASFTALVLFRLVQIFWSEGVSEGANQAMFNVIPPDQRERSRTFIRGIANQLGISVAGVLLLLGNRVLPSGCLFITGLLAAAVTIYFVWQARKAYGPAVVAALKAGQSHIFFSEEQPFGGFQQDANAVNAAVAGIHSQEVAVRRVAADILGRLSVPEATQAVVGALDDEDPSVRVALLKALSSSRSTTALLDVASLLQDPDPEVRLQAIKTLSDLAEYPQGLKTFLRPLLSDPDTAVRCRAAGALLKIVPDPEAEAMLVTLAQAESQTGEGIAGRIMALEALAAYGGQNAYQIAVDGLQDPSPAIRRASAMLIAQIDAEQCLVPLQIALGDEDELVRQAAAEALGHLGPPALETTLQALNSPRLEEGALLALQYLPARQAASRIQKYAEQKIERALFYHDLWLQCRGFIAGQQEHVSGKNAPIRQRELEIGPLLADLLRIKAQTHATQSLRAIGVIGNQEAIFLAIENLSSPITSQRANALETLDSVSRSGKVRRLFPLWETADPPIPPADDRWLATLLEDNDPWLRACATMVARKHDGQLFRSQLNQLAQDDPDPLVRESAQLPSNGEARMDTLQTLSTMERILFLRRVPLFATLPVSDLKQIAAVAGERAFGDGTIIAEQGEPGDVLYIIVSGEVVVTAESADGDKKELGLRQSGDFVGEMAIISDETRMASLSARGELRTLCISQSQFKEILRLRPEASLAVMSVLCARLREYQRYD